MGAALRRSASCDAARRAVGARLDSSRQSCRWLSISASALRGPGNGDAHPLERHLGSVGPSTGVAGTVVPVVACGRVANTSARPGAAPRPAHDETTPNSTTIGQFAITPASRRTHTAGHAAQHGDEDRGVVAQRGEPGAELRRGAARLACPDRCRPGRASWSRCWRTTARPLASSGQEARASETPASRAPPTKPAPPITTSMKIGSPVTKSKLIGLIDWQLGGVDGAAQPGDGGRQHEHGQAGAHQVEPEGGAGRLAVADGQQAPAERAAPDGHHHQRQQHEGDDHEDHLRLGSSRTCSRTARSGSTLSVPSSNS